MNDRYAPGYPGIEPRWTSSAKTGVGTALSRKSHVWFTLSHGIFNEVYYPQIDHACIRDMGFIVTNGKDFFSEEKRDTDHEIHWLAEGVPAFRLVNTCHHDLYRVEKQILTDPSRSTVLQQTQFIAQEGQLQDYKLYVLLAPHLANQGVGNNAWIEDFEGTPMLFAQRAGTALALACSVPWLKCSAGFVGVSDGWQDLKANYQMTWDYNKAENGNVALTAEIDLKSCKGKFVMALGLGSTPQEAAQNAKASLIDGFEKAEKDYLAGWNDWLKTHAPLPKAEASHRDLTRVSAAVLRAHESKTVPGGFIASLAIPWGASKGDNDLGGYHLVWSRDMVQTIGGLLALGAHEDAIRALLYLRSTQTTDGHWPQNMWLNGSPYWNGIQMDETALPILLVDMAYRQKALTDNSRKDFWPMVRKAAAYLVCNGPVTRQDRWEEDPGYTAFTIAAEIAALLAAADMADLYGEPHMAVYLRQTADTWNDSIERWLYVTGSLWCKQYGVDGYYVRIAAEKIDENPVEKVDVKNVETGSYLLASHLVSPDALALVRFGLREANDPRILNTVKVIDQLLKVDTPEGPVWHRYNHDGYGEKENGEPFDGSGIGRGWPLLTGERAHYELAAGHSQEAKKMMRTMASFANEGGLLPEQVWDKADIPERELYFGKPSGSAMPLVWAHAEYLKLRRSLQDGQLFDTPPQTVERYLKNKTVSAYAIWRFSHPITEMIFGKNLRVETPVPALIHWSSDNWATSHDVKTHDTGLGLHMADLSTVNVAQGQQVVFTFYWVDKDQWEGKNFSVQVGNL